MEPRPLPPRTLLLRSDPGASAVSRLRNEHARRWPAQGFRAAKKRCAQVDTLRCSRLLNRGSSVWGIASCPQLSVLPGGRVSFLRAPLVAKEGDMSLCLTLSLCPQRCLNTVPVVLRAAGWRWLPQSLAQRLVGQQTGAACRPLHGAGGS